MERYVNEFMNDVARSARVSGYVSIGTLCNDLKYDGKMLRRDEYDIIRTTCNRICARYTMSERVYIFTAMDGAVKRYVIEFGKAVKRANSGRRANMVLSRQVDSVITKHRSGVVNGFEAVKSIVDLTEHSVLDGYGESYRRIHPLRF